VAMNRTLTTMRIYSQFDTSDIRNVEGLFKELIMEVIQTDESQKLVNGIKKPFYNFKENFKDLTFANLSDLFLNSANFYKETASMQGVQNIFNGIRQGIDIAKNIVGVAGEIGSIKSIVGDYHKQNDYNKLQKKLGESSSIEKSLSNQQEVLQSALGLIKPVMKGASLIGPIVKALSAALQLNDLFSFISFKTYEYKIDDYQSIYYFGSVPKLPILNIELGDGKPKDVIATLLTNSIVEGMIPSNTPKSEKERLRNSVYSFGDKYYLNKNDAIEAFKNELYIHPE
jgi:hypothetical protein